MPQATKLSQAQIQKIVALRGLEPAGDIRKRFRIGTSRLYRIWKNAEATGQAAKQVAPAANGRAPKQVAAATGPATKQVAPAVANSQTTPGNGQTVPGTGQTALVPAGANGKAAKQVEAADVAVLQQTLGRMEEQMGRLEKQQALLLESQEVHYEDVEELEGTVEQAIEDGTSILDDIEEGSRQARTTAENILAIANSAKDAALVLVSFGGLGLLLWMLSWKALATSSP